MAVCWSETLNLQATHKNTLLVFSMECKRGKGWVETGHRMGINGQGWVETGHRMGRNGLDLFNSTLIVYM